MKKSRLPKTDSIKKLAEFWDSYDLTDFGDELEEVAEPVFVTTALQSRCLLKRTMPKRSSEWLRPKASPRTASPRMSAAKMARRNIARPTNH